MESLVLEDLDFYTPSTMPSQAQTSTSCQSSRDDMQHFTMYTNVYNQDNQQELTVTDVPVNQCKYQK